ncbi:kinase suppressor of Ras 1-like isoform X2 [Limulus polyphemus]|uniref:Kinase suppressor of Ras 1-like isoform X2 n=1 Tax=Limulus polyphemus TaxID=6850 RepID=A0ABM1SZF0_LIMPO|nr:kinase suppressor of Ras 1-like isoform X2 [Limulus polyphemus]
MAERRKRLSRSLSTPRRCLTCQKMVYLTAFRCKDCGNVTHDSCVNNESNMESRCHGNRINYRNSFQYPITTVGETTEVNWFSDSEKSAFSSPTATENNLPRSSFSDMSNTDVKSASLSGKNNSSLALSGLLKVVHWLAQRRRNRDMSKANAADKHAKAKYGLNQCKVSDKQTRKKLKAFLKNSQKSKSAVIGLTCSSRACTCGWTRLPITSSQSTNYASLISPNSSLSSSSCLSSTSSAAQTPSDTESDYRIRVNDRIPLWLDKNFRDVRSVGLTCSSSRSPSIGGATPAFLKSENKNSSVNSNRSQCISAQGRCAKQWLTKARTLSLETKNSPSHRLCATWPPYDICVSSVEDFVDDDSESGIGDCEDQDEFPSHAQSLDLKETLGEWCIPFDDLKFDERLRHGRQGDIFRGRWHGEVLIYTVRQQKEAEFRQFLDDVRQLSMIRHENVVLFMGACIEPPQLAVITSMRKGPLLFEHIHIKHHRLSFFTKISIARQIAQGMGYLHAKGIIHKKLNSRNVILESRVKLCLMDQGMSDSQLDRAEYGCVPRGHLAYFSPEILQNLQIEPPKVYSTMPYTQEADIFAFGSILYELFAEEFPFSHLSPHSVIWLVASGRRQCLSNLKCTSGLKSLILECWSHSPSDRPGVVYIIKQLQESVSLHKRHSSSEPERLHRMGTSLGRNFCGR